MLWAWHSRYRSRPTAHVQMKDQRWTIVATQVPLAKRSWSILLSGSD